MKDQFQARMLRIHFGEGDKWQGKPLHQAIVAKCMELGMAGATCIEESRGTGKYQNPSRNHWTFSRGRAIMLTSSTRGTDRKADSPSRRCGRGGAHRDVPCRGHSILADFNERTDEGLTGPGWTNYRAAQKVFGRKVITDAGI